MNIVTDTVVSTSPSALKPGQKPDSAGWVPPYSASQVNQMMIGARWGEMEIIDIYRSMRDGGAISHREYFENVVHWAICSVEHNLPKIRRMRDADLDRMVNERVVDCLRRWEEPAFADIYAASPKTIQQLASRIATI